VVCRGSGGKVVWTEEVRAVIYLAAWCTVRRVHGEEKGMGGHAGLVGRGIGTVSPAVEKGLNPSGCRWCGVIGARRDMPATCSTTRQRRAG
jgi:hypothetical protein